MECSRHRRADVLSNLPGDIINNILSRLPLPDVVRTSMWSREWRYRWTFNPVLEFGHHFMPFLRNHRLETLIYRFLLHHQGPIDKFAFQVPVYASASDLDRWILLLSKYKVQDFTLQLSNRNKHLLSSHLFAFQHLKHIKLYRCVFRLPPAFKGFRSLAALDYQEVDFDPTVFGQFISQCSMLESVRLVDCTDFVSIEVEGPKLKFFSFHGIFKSIRFKNCPILAEVSLSIPVTVYGEIRLFPGHVKYLDFHPTLKKLHLHPHMLQFLGAGIPSGLPRSLNNLKVLDLPMYLDTIEEVSCALFLIKSSPNLEMLRLTFYIKEPCEKVKAFIQAQETRDHYLNQLRRIEIKLFSGMEPEMEFARYLLASAAVLVEMVISPYGSSFAGKMPNIIIQLQHSPKASPSAQVVSRNWKERA